MEMPIGVLVSIIIAVIIFSAVALFANFNVGSSSTTASATSKFYSICKPGKITDCETDMKSFCASNGLEEIKFKRVCEAMNKTTRICINDCCRLAGKL